MSNDTPIQLVTTPSAVRVIVTYTAKVPAMQYSQLEASTIKSFATAVKTIWATIGARLGGAK